MRGLEVDLKLTVLSSCFGVMILGYPPFLEEASGVIVGVGVGGVRKKIWCRGGSRLNIGGLTGLRRRRRKPVVQDKSADTLKGDLLIGAGVIWSNLMRRSR